MKYQVILFENGRGDKPVKEFIWKFDEKTVSKFVRLSDLLSELGPALSMPYSKKLNKELYELRIKGKNEIRILYYFKGQKCYLLHAFLKKTRKTPLREIDTANQRILFT